jgi:hypothetical protein
VTYVLGVEDVKFKIGTKGDSLAFVHPFVARPLEICSAGIHCMNCLRKLGAEINVNFRSLAVTDCSFRLSDSGDEALTAQSLANNELEKLRPEETVGQMNLWMIG